LNLNGFVQNRRSEVVAEIQGPKDAADNFYGKLKNILPPSALIESYTAETIPLKDEESFKIIESLSTTYNFPPIPPDLALCDDCREELFNPGNRRYLYPFITCTQCGPRYSIVEDTPFDRETTSMIDFPQCSGCSKEYTDPMDRRFHSQTNSCSLCGPELTLVSAPGKIISGDPVLNTINALNQGNIVAIQGIGGFHLAADPLHSEAVLRLRSDKEREKKPFALMVRDMETADELTILEEEDKKILSSSASPILILPCRENNPEALKAVSDTNTLGIFLPYTPLHLLLFLHPHSKIRYKYLIMTSGNLKDEPIITDPHTALTKLGRIADMFLYNNRRIIFRTDDSIVRRGKYSGRAILRRSRGFVPKLIHIKYNSPQTVIGIGGDLKSAPALLKGNDIYLSPYIGDLDNPITEMEFKKQITKILSLYNVQPDRIVYDMHPGYHSSKWARNASFPQKTEVQHHHAHILSVMAEHNLDEVLGLSFDGTGYGTDGNIWGGEFIHATRSDFVRLGHFMYFPLPGGETAIRNPARILAGLLYDSIEPDDLYRLLKPLSDLSEKQYALLLDILKQRINTPLTSSLGRIFDAAAAALGLVRNVTYEGEGPIKLEGIAALHPCKTGNTGQLYTDKSTSPKNMPEIKHDRQNDSFQIDVSKLLHTLLTEKNNGNISRLAFMFHSRIADASVAGADIMREKTGINSIALSGGVFQNIILREILIPKLKQRGYDVYLNISVPPGDGGLSIGQVYFNYKQEGGD